MDNFHEQQSIIDACPACLVLSMEGLTSLVNGMTDAAEFYGPESKLLKELGLDMGLLGIRQLRESMEKEIDDDWISERPALEDMLLQQTRQLMNKGSAIEARIYLELSYAYPPPNPSKGGVQGLIQQTLEDTGSGKRLMWHQIVVLSHALIKATDHLITLYNDQTKCAGVEEHLFLIAQEAATSTRILNRYVTNLHESDDTVLEIHRRFMDESGTGVLDLANINTIQLPDRIFGVRWENLTYPPDSGRRKSRGTRSTFSSMEAFLKKNSNRP